MIKKKKTLKINQPSINQTAGKTKIKKKCIGYEISKHSFTGHCQTAMFQNLSTHTDKYWLKNKVDDNQKIPPIFGIHKQRFHDLIFLCKS